MDGQVPLGPALIFDCDHYYMASVVAERLCAAGLEVHLVTSADRVSAWSANTGERWRVQQRMLELDVNILTGHVLQNFKAGEAFLSCVYTEREYRLAAQSVVMVGQRKPVDRLYYDVQERMRAGTTAAPKSLNRIGDCQAPAIIAAAIYAGHRYARELDCTSDDGVRHDRVFFQDV